MWDNLLYALVASSIILAVLLKVYGSRILLWVITHLYHSPSLWPLVRSMKRTHADPLQQFELHKQQRALMSKLKNLDKTDTERDAGETTRVKITNFLVPRYKVPFLQETSKTDDVVAPSASSSPPPFTSLRRQLHLTEQEVTPSSTIPCRFYVPSRSHVRTSSSTPLPLVFFYHGGGWSLGDLDCYETICKDIATKCSVAIVSIEYRLSPEHPFPASINDCLNVVDTMSRCDGEYAPIVSADTLIKASEQGLRTSSDKDTDGSIIAHPSHRHSISDTHAALIDLSKLFFMGDSAGGNLCMATPLLAMDLQLPFVRAIKGIFSIYPVATTCMGYSKQDASIKSMILHGEDMVKFFRYHGNMTKEEWARYDTEFDAIARSKSFAALLDANCISAAGAVAVAASPPSTTLIRSQEDFFLQRCARLRSPYLHLLNHPRVNPTAPQYQHNRAFFASPAKVPLPPAFVFVAEYDPLRDEGVELWKHWTVAFLDKKNTHPARHLYLQFHRQFYGGGKLANLENVRELPHYKHAGPANEHGIVDGMFMTYLPKSTHGCFSFPFMYDTAFIVSKIKKEVEALCAL